MLRRQGSPPPLPLPCSMHLLHPDVPDLISLYSKLESNNQDVPLGSVSFSSKLSKPKDEVMRISDLQVVSQTYR